MHGYSAFVQIFILSISCSQIRNFHTLKGKIISEFHKASHTFIFNKDRSLNTRFANFIANTKQKPNVAVAAALISEFGKVKDIEHARKVFEFVLKSKSIDLPLIRSYITACKNSMYFIIIIIIFKYIILIFFKMELIMI